MKQLRPFKKHRLVYFSHLGLIKMSYMCFVFYSAISVFSLSFRLGESCLLFAIFPKAVSREREGELGANGTMQMAPEKPRKERPWDRKLGRRRRRKRAKEEEEEE